MRFACTRFALNHVRKGSLDPAEVPDAGKTEDRSQKDRSQKARPPKRRLPPQQCPPEAINHANHRIAGVEQAPWFGNEITAEADRRYVKAELDEEWNDITKIAVLHVQGAQPETRPEGSAESQGDKERNSYHSPVGQKAVPHHHRRHQAERDQEINEARDDGARGHDQTREIDFGDQVGVADQAIAGLAQRR